MSYTVPCGGNMCIRLPEGGGILTKCGAEQECSYCQLVRELHGALEEAYNYIASGEEPEPPKVLKRARAALSKVKLSDKF